MTLRQLYHLIDPAFNGAIHEDAVGYGDAMVQRLRIERGVET
jgi:hypothetical protein